jgi:hypothetical protein
MFTFLSSIFIAASKFPASYMQPSFFISTVHHLKPEVNNHHKLPTPLSTIIGMLQSKERAVSIHGERKHTKKMDPGFTMCLF